MDVIGNYWLAILRHSDTAYNIPKWDLTIIFTRPKLPVEEITQSYVIFYKFSCSKFSLAPMGVLAPGSAHA